MEHEDERRAVWSKRAGLLGRVQRIKIHPRRWQDTAERVDFAQRMLAAAPAAVAV